jgi:hypothetical protein
MKSIDKLKDMARDLKIYAEDVYNGIDNADIQEAMCSLIELIDVSEELSKELEKVKF